MRPLFRIDETLFVKEIRASAIRRERGDGGGGRVSSSATLKRFLSNTHERPIIERKALQLTLCSSCGWYICKSYPRLPKKMLCPL